MDLIVDGLHKNKITLLVIGVIVSIACGVALAEQTNNYTIYTSLYNYRSCEIYIIFVDPPPRPNSTSTHTFIPCYHLHGFPTDVQPGSPPLVNTNLWIGIVLGILLIISSLIMIKTEDW